MAIAVQERDAAQPAEPAATPASTAGVVERYQTMVYAIALTHTHYRADADDVFQEAFLAYHRKSPQCDDEEHRKAWLIRTTLNCAKQVAGSSWRRRVALTGDDQLLEGPAGQVFRFENDDQQAVFQALASLPEAYRTVLHLFYFEDLPVAQISGLLSLSDSAVKMRLTRGRDLLRDQLDEGLIP